MISPLGRQGIDEYNDIQRIYRLYIAFSEKDNIFYGKIEGINGMAYLSMLL